MGLEKTFLIVEEGTVFNGLGLHSPAFIGGKHSLAGEKLGRGGVG